MAEPTKPRRIQLSRRAGWRLADHSTNVVIVDRRGPYGNPFRAVRSNGMIQIYDASGNLHHSERARHGDVRRQKQELLVARFEQWVSLSDLPTDKWSAREILAHVRLTSALRAGKLTGKDLACWCRLPEPGEPDYCHAAVLLRYANGGPR
jgi:hypothetical protein